jgi:hypothetical protein
MAQQVPGDVQGAVAQACCPPHCASAWVPVDASWARELLTHAACRAARVMERGRVQVCGAATPARRGHPVPARPVEAGPGCGVSHHLWCASLAPSSCMVNWQGSDVCPTADPVVPQAVRYAFESASPYRARGCVVVCMSSCAWLSACFPTPCSGLCARVHVFACMSSNMICALAFAVCAPPDGEQEGPPREQRTALPRVLGFDLPALRPPPPRL